MERRYFGFILEKEREFEDAQRGRDLAEPHTGETCAVQLAGSNLA